MGIAPALKNVGCPRAPLTRAVPRLGLKSSLAGDKLCMTQELIADMLGVRREGVTEAAGKLQRAGLIAEEACRLFAL